jgi:hypothetical protein
MMKKEEEIEKLEEEVVTLRFKLINLNKNVEEIEASASLVEAPKRKNEENPNTYVEVIKGFMKKEESNPMKENVLEVQNSQEEDYIRRPSTFKPQRRFNHDHDQSRKEFKRTISQ